MAISYLTLHRALYTGAMRAEALSAEQLSYFSVMTEKVMQLFRLSQHHQWVAGWLGPVGGWVGVWLGGCLTGYLGGCLAGCLGGWWVGLLAARARCACCCWLAGQLPFLLQIHSCTRESSSAGRKGAQAHW